jgi:hypothetical protein
MIKAKSITSKIREASDHWTVYLQKNLNGSVANKEIFSGSMAQCVSYLKDRADYEEFNFSGGVLVDDGGVKNTFFVVDNGHIKFGPSPFPGLKYNTTKKFEPFK